MSLINKDRLWKFLVRFTEFYVDGFCYYCEGKSHFKKYEAETASLRILIKSNKQKNPQPNQLTKKPNQTKYPHRHVLVYIYMTFKKIYSK